MPFELGNAPPPAGDQPRAIRELNDGLRRGDKYQTLLGVTGSGKTMTMAHVVADFGKPTLVLSYNCAASVLLCDSTNVGFPKSATTCAIVIVDFGKPTLVLSHNKTLAAQL